MHILILLVCAHALCDYPLQGDFLSRGKNRISPLPGVPWYQCLGAHAAIHAGAVYLITGMWWLAALEFICHWIIDDSKCSGIFGTGEIAFNVDQVLHVAFKVLWTGLLYLYLWR